MSEPMLSVAGLCARGWTAALIARLLGEPDKLATNPHYKSRPPMRLYAISRLEQAEGSADYAAAKAKSYARVAAAKRVAKAKRDELLRQIEALSVHVRVEHPHILLRKAIGHYNTRLSEREALLSERGKDTWFLPTAENDSDPEFLARIQVHYIRHQLTRYDTALEAVARKIGADEARAQNRQKVYAAIARTYPHFRECARQLQARQVEETAP